MNPYLNYEQLVPFATGLGVTLILVFLLNKFLSIQVEKVVAANPGLTTTYRYVRRLAVSVVLLTGVTLSSFAAFPTLQGLASSIVITLGFASIVIGLAAQQSISNLIAGFLVSISRPFQIGDAVVFHDEFCFVEDITLMHSILRTWDNRRLVVPNSTVLSEVITNYSKKDPTMLAPVFVTITYESDLDKAMEIMVDEARKHKDCLPIGDLPNIVVMEYGERGISLRLLSRAKDQPTAFMMIRDLLYSVKRRFDKEGISLAPSRTYVALDKSTRQQVIDLAKAIMSERKTTANL
ncbi:mechanosensitive ion channel family protein [[Eubacterium] cellulosolvens]